MKLLAAAREGELAPGLPLSKEAAQFVRRAGLLIASATAISPIVWRYPWAPRISHTLRNGALKHDSLSLDCSGLISDRMRWIWRMAHGFAALHNAEAAALRDQAETTARHLRALLVRFNLLFSILEAVRSVEDDEAIVRMATNRLDIVLRDFMTFGIWPPETVGRALARNRLFKVVSSIDAVSGAECIKAADLLIREATPLAARARRAVRFDELIATAQELLPVYWAAVILFYSAMAATEGPLPKDALRDFRVIEEYQVGTLELFTDLGHHL